MIYIFLTILILSIVIAVISMYDYDLPSSLKKIITGKTIKGSIIFFKQQIKHYSSSSSDWTGRKLSSSKSFSKRPTSETSSSQTFSSESSC